jgi:Frag1/DRAM/Sfk1 family
VQITDEPYRYISDIGAHSLQPLFIAMGTVSVVSFDMVFIAERWLRHRGKLAPNTSWLQKALSICAIISAIIGAIALILLTCLNDLHHGTAHDICLAIFMYFSYPSPPHYPINQPQTVPAT